MGQGSGIKSGNFLLMLWLSAMPIPGSTGVQAAEPDQACGWRGDGTGLYPKAAPPLTWDGETKKNILWSVKTGAGKFTSPIVMGDKIFAVSEPSQLICLEARSGKVLWQKPNGFSELPAKVEEKKARGSPGNVTPTPVSDGRFVYVTFGCGIVGCYDLEGQRQWLKYIEQPPGTEFGRSSSPVLAGDKLLVNIHHLMALEARTGELLWQNQKVIEKYGTCAVMTVGGSKVVLSPSGHIVRLKDGAILGAIPELQYVSPLIHGTVAYFVGATTAAIEFTAPTSDSIKTKTLWTTDLEGTFFASPVRDQGLLFVVSNEGDLSVLNVSDGKNLGTTELEIPAATGRNNLPAANIYPSLTIASGHLFLSNDAGDTFVLVPGREYKEASRNHLPAGSGGTPAFAAGRIYARAGEYLYCIGEK